jgi:hypothetical protein
MRGVSLCVVVVVVAVFGADACTRPPVVIAEGEGDEGEGDHGEGEGEGDVGGEGESESPAQVPLPARACTVVSVDGVAGAAVHPGRAALVEARLPLTRASGSVHVVVVDSGGADAVAFIASRVGDVVFGEGDAACFVHVAAWPGLTIELSWAEPNNDADVELTLENDDGAFCASGDVDFALDGVVMTPCAGPRHCDYSNCNPDGAYTVDFDGDGVTGAGDPRHQGDHIDGPATEHIVLDVVPRGRLLATAHTFDNGPTEAVVRAWLDDVAIGEARELLESNNVGAPLLISLDDGVCVGGVAAAACGVSRFCDACGPGLACDDDDDGACAPAFACPAVCAGACSAVDGGCLACEFCDDGCDQVTGHCHERCVDAFDVVDGSVLAEGASDDVVCPGDVDVFAVADVAAFDIVAVSAFPDLAVTLEDAEGVLDVGASVFGVVRAPPVIVRLHNDGAENASDGVVRLEVDRLADRCAADDEFEPDEDAARAAEARADGVLCPAADVDCVDFAPDVDRAVYLDRLAGDADCVIDEAAGGCFDDGRRFVVAAGDTLRLCVRSNGDVPGTPWHFRSEAP